MPCACFVCVFQFHSAEQWTIIYSRDIHSVAMDSVRVIRHFWNQTSSHRKMENNHNEDEHKKKLYRKWLKVVLYGIHRDITTITIWTQDEQYMCKLSNNRYAWSSSSLLATIGPILLLQKKIHIAICIWNAFGDANSLSMPMCWLLVLCSSQPYTICTWLQSLAQTHPMPCLLDGLPFFLHHYHLLFVVVAIARSDIQRVYLFLRNFFFFFCCFARTSTLRCVVTMILLPRDPEMKARDTNCTSILSVADFMIFICFLFLALLLLLWLQP